jgi:hypothetical protein
MTAGRGMTAADFGRRGARDTVISLLRAKSSNDVRPRRAARATASSTDSDAPAPVTAFEPRVVVHADPRQHRDLLPAQARDPSLVTEAGQTNLLRGQPGSATGQKLLNVHAAIHVLDATTHAPAETGPVSTRISGSSRALAWGLTDGVLTRR